MKNRFIFSLAIFCLFLSNGFVCAETKPIAKGARFPNVIFQDNLLKEERSYLGLSRKTKFSLKEVSGILFLIEVFSTYCTSCPKNVPVFNDVYSAIENDPGLKGKVKVFSIAVGNTANEVESFKKAYKVLYPVLTDLHFTAHKALGNPRVPYTIVIRRNTKGNILVDTHQGVIDPSYDVLNNIRGFLLK